MWNRNGEPYAVITHPYRIQGVDALAQFCELHNLNLRVDPGLSWHYPGRTFFVEITRGADFNKVNDDLLDNLPADVLAVPTFTGPEGPDFKRFDVHWSMLKRNLWPLIQVKSRQGGWKGITVDLLPAGRKFTELGMSGVQEIFHELFKVNRNTTMGY